MAEALDLLLVISQIGTAFATIALVVILFKTVKQLEHTVELSQIQTKYRFRPWIGPISNIIPLNRSMNNRHQFDVVVKNYGELPAKEVTVWFRAGTEMLSKKNLQAKGVETFNLGPILPNMEKHYWFFIDSDMWKKAEHGVEKIFVIIYFEYMAINKKSGYGMISEYDRAGNGGSAPSVAEA